MRSKLAIAALSAAISFKNVQASEIETCVAPSSVHKNIENALPQLKQVVKRSDRILAQTSAFAKRFPVPMPNEPNYDGKLILDTEQLAMLPIVDIQWNGQMATTDNGPPLDGNIQLSGWQFDWSGTDTGTIAVIKHQTQRDPRTEELHLMAWTHSMAYPDTCTHAMQNMVTHLNQSKSYSDDIEGFLAKQNDRIETLTLDIAEFKHVQTANGIVADASKTQIMGIIDQVMCEEEIEMPAVEDQLHLDEKLGLAEAEVSPPVEQVLLAEEEQPVEESEELAEEEQPVEESEEESTYSLAAIDRVNNIHEGDASKKTNENGGVPGSDFLTQIQKFENYEHEEK